MLRPGASTPSEVPSAASSGSQPSSGSRAPSPVPSPTCHPLPSHLSLLGWWSLQSPRPDVGECTLYALEKVMATHSSVLAWGIPGTGEPGGLLSMGSHRVGHD